MANGKLNLVLIITGYMNSMILTLTLKKMMMKIQLISCLNSFHLPKVNISLKTMNGSLMKWSLSLLTVLFNLRGKLSVVRLQVK